MNAYEAIDLSGIADTGPDQECTYVLNSKVINYIYDAPGDSLLILDGQIATVDIAGSIGAVCIMVNGVFCSGQSVNDQLSGGSASCLMPIQKGRNTIKIAGVHNYGLSRFRVGFSAMPL